MCIYQDAASFSFLSLVSYVLADSRVVMHCMHSLLDPDVLPLCIMAGCYMQLLCIRHNEIIAIYKRLKQHERDKRQY